MDWAAFPAGFAACAILVIAIGAQNSFVLHRALRNQHVVAVVFSCVLADALLISIGMLGFGRVIEGRPWALDVARWLGAAFLFAYGVKALWRARSSHGLVAAGAENPTLIGTLGTLAALTFLNPHVYVDTVVLLGAVGSTQPLDGRVPFALGAIFASLSWFVLIGFGARHLSGFFSSARAWRYLDIGLGTVTLAMAVGLAMD